MTRKRTDRVAPKTPRVPDPLSVEMTTRIETLGGRIDADHPMGRVAVIPAGKLRYLIVNPGGRTPDQLAATFARNLIRTAEADAHEVAAAALRDLLGVPSRQDMDEAIEEVRRSIDGDIERIREELS